MMEERSSICILTDDCLINVFKHCDIQSLGRAASTCKRFSGIIRNDESIWLPKSRMVLGSNMNSPLMLQRSIPVLTAFQRCKVSYNWVGAICEKTTPMTYSNCLPWMYMEKDYLFVSKGQRIVKLFRDINGNILTRRVSDVPLHDDDISKFVINGEEIFSVGWDGKLCRIAKSSLRCMRSQRAHSSEALALDSKNDIVVTGSRDETIKIWKISENDMPLTKVGEIATGVRVLSLSLLQSPSTLIVGLPGTKNIHPLAIYDIENARIFSNLGESFLKGGGIMDIYPESENLILTCGYDTKVKLWDVRAPRNCVSQWTEPFDNVLYSVKSDHSFSVVAGASRSGFFHLWDKRTRAVVQTYYTKTFNSPVYCLSFDATHAYSALNEAVLQYWFMPENKKF